MLGGRAAVIPIVSNAAAIFPVMFLFTSVTFAILRQTHTCHASTVPGASRHHRDGEHGSSGDARARAARTPGPIWATWSASAAVGRPLRAPRQARGNATRPADKAASPRVGAARTLANGRARRHRPARSPWPCVPAMDGRRKTTTPRAGPMIAIAVETIRCAARLVDGARGSSPPTTC